MLTSYYAARANLYYLWKKHPEWKHGQFAAALGCSKEWVKKWLKRLQEELTEGKALEEILQGHSRARKQAPEKTHPVVVAEILSIRDQPPEGLRRFPAKKLFSTILSVVPFSNSCSCRFPPVRPFIVSSKPTIE